MIREIDVRNTEKKSFLRHVRDGVPEQKERALAVVARWVERPRVAGRIPGSGRGSSRLGGGPGARSVAWDGRAMGVCFSHVRVSVPLFLPPLPSL